MVDSVAAVVLAAAAGWCGFRLAPGPAVAPAAAAVGLCLAFGLLRAVRPEPRRFALGHFAPPEAPVCDEARHAVAGEDSPEDAGDADELMLDDVLAEISRESRVVRLFDRAAMPTSMPTPGELQARIDRHLGSDRLSAAPPRAVQMDASQALHEALAELRRSLR